MRREAPREDSGHASAPPSDDALRLSLVSVVVIALFLSSLLALFATALLGGTSLRGVSATLAEVERLQDAGQVEEALALLRIRGLLSHPDAVDRSLELLIAGEAWHEALELALHSPGISQSSVQRLCADAPAELLELGLDRPTALRLHQRCGDRLEGLSGFRVRARAGILEQDDASAALLHAAREALEEGALERVRRYEQALLEAASLTRHLHARELHLRRAFAIRHADTARAQLVAFYAEAWEEDMERDPQQAYTWAQRIGLDQVDGLRPSEEERARFVRLMNQAMARALRDRFQHQYLTWRAVPTDIEAGIYLPDEERFVFPAAPLEVRDPEVYAWIASRFGWRNAPPGFNVLEYFGLCRDPERDCVLDFEDIYQIWSQRDELSIRHGGPE